ncbi:MAG: SIR2 family NAD-dependent protein deacylase [Limnobacter sp.]|uniref:SIR2 family NAD-dependent protein deacylase n=1 Tax=Limnobacter sp. TaxID=2003368 RepID=UPI00391C36DC
MKPPIIRGKIAFFTGAGLSAESGLTTFRGEGGLWNGVDVHTLASLQGWNANPAQVLDFYNQRRMQALAAHPNSAHQIIADLQAHREVVVITQNIDDLHERAGSEQVIHLHGDILHARSAKSAQRIYPVGPEGIRLGDLCEYGFQRRPNVVWFGEEINHLELAKKHVMEAEVVVAIGTSLAVQPAASLLKHARFHARKLLITLDLAGKVPHGFKWLRARASQVQTLLRSL